MVQKRVTINTTASKTVRMGPTIINNYTVILTIL